MMPQRSKNIVKACLLGMLASTLLACQNSTFDTIQSVTYKPDFHYISHAKWVDTMRKFEVYSNIIHKRLADSPTMTADQTASTLSILNKMDDLSLMLSQSKLDAHLDFTLFRQGIATAREELQQSPPNYQQLYVISTYCSNCHSMRSN